MEKGEREEEMLFKRTFCNYLEEKWRYCWEIGVCVSGKCNRFYWMVKKNKLNTANIMDKDYGPFIFISLNFEPFMYNKKNVEN